MKIAQELVNAVRVLSEDGGDYLDMLNMEKQEGIAYTLGSAFVWDESPQGFDFWCNIDNTLWKTGYNHRSTAPF